MTEASLTLLIVAGSVALFVWNRLSVGVVAILTAMALYVTGVLDAETVLAGFGDPVVIFIATLFVVSEGLDATGVTAWVGQALTRGQGRSRTLLITIVLALSAGVSALISPNGAVAALLPVAVALSRRLDESPSRSLMPLAYAASAGALLTLSGSPVNVIVSDASRDAGGAGFAFFEFAIVGLPLVIVTILVSSLLGRRLLPDRSSAALPPDFSMHAATLIDHYALDHGYFRLRVNAGSTLAGLAWPGIAETYPEARLVGVQDRSGGPSEAATVLELGDVLVLTGSSEDVMRLAVDHGLSIDKTPLTRSTREALFNREVGIAELVVPPRSPLIGDSVFPGMVRDGRVVVLAVHRLGRALGSTVHHLAEGDTLLVHGTWPAIEELAHDRDVLVVDSPELVRRQAVVLGARAKTALAVLAGMVVALASGAVPPAIAGLAAATAMVALRAVTVAQAYRAISWQTVVLIGALIPLSVAIRSSGADDVIAEWIIDLVGASSPYLLLCALFGLTAVLGQIISNTATVLIVVPIATAAAIETGVALQPVLMLVAVAGAASFLTPIATPANMMVMGPAGYRFGDYWKLGLVTMIVWLGLALLIIPLAWPL